MQDGKGRCCAFLPWVSMPGVLKEAPYEPLCMGAGKSEWRVGRAAVVDFESGGGCRSQACIARWPTLLAVAAVNEGCVASLPAPTRVGTCAEAACPLLLRSIWERGLSDMCDIDTQAGKLLEVDFARN